MACFNNVVGVPLDSIPAKVLCSQISPSFAQFWRKVLEPQSSTQKTPTYLDIRVSQVLEGFRRREIANYRPDFALRGAGAFVLLGFTTPTFKPPHSNQAYDNFNHPSIVLEEQVVVGDCWEFFGFEGHVGIHLPEKVNITEVAVSYAHPKLILHRMMKKAPRSITVWALTDPGQFSVSRFRRPDEFSTTKCLPLFVQSGQIFLPILEAEYLVASDSDNPVQAFRLANDFPASQIIIVEITSNWGSPTTCIHHFGIHGAPIEFD